MEREIYKKDIERPGNSISFSVAIPQKFYGLSIDLDIEIPYLGYGFLFIVAKPHYSSNLHQT